MVQARRFACEYYGFYASTAPSIPFVGDSAIVCLSRRLLKLGDRGVSVPAKGRYYVKVVGGVGGVMNYNARQ